MRSFCKLKADTVHVSFIIKKMFSFKNLYQLLMYNYEQTGAFPKKQRLFELSAIPLYTLLFIE